MWRMGWKRWDQRQGVEFETWLSQESREEMMRSRGDGEKGQMQAMAQGQINMKDDGERQVTWHRAFQWASAVSAFSQGGAETRVLRVGAPEFGEREGGLPWMPSSLTGGAWPWGPFLLLMHFRHWHQSSLHHTRAYRVWAIFLWDSAKQHGRTQNWLL